MDRIEGLQRAEAICKEANQPDLLDQALDASAHLVQESLDRASDEPGIVIRGLHVLADNGYECSGLVSAASEAYGDDPWLVSGLGETSIKVASGASECSALQSERVAAFEAAADLGQRDAMSIGLFASTVGRLAMDEIQRRCESQAGDIAERIQNQIITPQLAERTADGGTLRVDHARSTVVLVYAAWEDDYRKRIANEMRFSRKNELTGEALADQHSPRQRVPEPADPHSRIRRSAFQTARASSEARMDTGGKETRTRPAHTAQLTLGMNRMHQGTA